MPGLILPGNNNDLSKMAKEAGAPPPNVQPQPIPIDRIIVEISAQVARQLFEQAIKPYEERIKALEDKLNADNSTEEMPND